MARQPGTAARNKAFLQKRLKDMYGDDFEPVMKMAENAVFLQSVAKRFQDEIVDSIKAGALVDSALDQATESTNTAIAAWDRIAKYTTPQLKQIEIHGDVDATIHKPMQDVLDRIEELTGNGTDRSAEGSVS